MNQATVREIAAASPNAVRIFEKYRIDYCCGGARRLEDVCGERGLSVEAVLAEVEAGTPSDDHRNWSEASLADLIHYIVDRHHGYLNRELPALEARFDKTIAKHGQTHPELIKAQFIFLGLKQELSTHLFKEERVLFPAIEALEVAHGSHTSAPATCFGTLRNPIGMMEHEHDDAGHALSKLRGLSHDYVPPAGACPTFHALYQGLRELERDLHTHIHLENNILFPRAARLEMLLNQNLQ